MYQIIDELERHSPSMMPLSSQDFCLVSDLLRNGCKLYYQRGKQRISRGPEQLVLASHLVGDRALRAYYPSDSIGLDVESLPLGIGIIDVDDVLFAQAVLSGLGGDHHLTLERTPSGGLHLWGRGVPKDTPLDGLCSAGVRVEFFTKGRITIIGRGRALLGWKPL